MLLAEIAITDWPGAVAYMTMCICFAFAVWAIYGHGPLIIINRKKD